MPLPYDLASVAWLAALHWGPEDTQRSRIWESKRARRRMADLELVVRDQQRYIATLEAQLAPHLVRPAVEQESLL